MVQLLDVKPLYCKKELDGTVVKYSTAPLKEGGKTLAMSQSGMAMLNYGIK